jgi:hypothetical protein
VMPLTKKTLYFYYVTLISNGLILLCFLIKPLDFLSWNNIWEFLEQGRNAPIASLKMTFDQTIFANMKVFLSRGILLSVSFWTSCFILLLLKLKGNNPFFRKISFALLVGLLVGTLGIFCNNQLKIKSYTPMVPSAAMIFQEGDQLEQIASFNRFDEKFLNYLKKAELGEIKLSIINANRANDNQLNDPSRAHYNPSFMIGDKSISYSSTIYLRPQEITELLRTKALSYTYRFMKGGYFYMYTRAAGRPMTSRKDTLIVNNKNIPIMDADLFPDALPLVFRFEELGGKPIIAFY